MGAERETGRGAAAVGAADAMQLGQLAEAVSGSAITMDGDAVQVEWLAADVPAVETGTPHADAHPLDDEVAFQLRDRADDGHQRATQRAAGVDVLAVADELDAEMVELVEHFEEVLGRARHAIEGPYQHDVDITSLASFGWPS